ncbi:MAG: Lon family ATP-dependent protease, partial [Clostridia bacterium]|nr:Lon family ATP-dependent protease [Clostridia bacterium]
MAEAAETEELDLKKQVNALYQLLINLYGSDKLVLRATKLNALGNIKSDSLSERVLALQKIIQEEPVLDHLPEIEEIPAILENLHEQIADNLARRSVEDDIEKKINNRLQQKHEEYVKEIKLQILKEDGGPENAQTLKKLAILEKMEQKQMARTAMEFLRPAALEEIIGQQAAVKALLAKLASSFPQHILLYGPPGVGKTTAARLVLEAVKQLPSSPFQEDSPFIEVNGSTLRWDPREVTNPLLGSVHDPIYQGAKRDLADSGIPEPKLGLVSDAHGGVLFIDEIGEMDLLLQNKLLKVLEDKRVFFDSSYYDSHDPNIPAYVRKIFEEGAPADFILIGATTRSPQDLNPAIRSRCAEVYFEPLTPADLQQIVEQAAEKLQVQLADNVAETIAEYTIEGRKAVNILADAYGTALGRNGFAENNPLIELEDVYAVVQAGRLSPYV